MYGSGLRVGEVLHLRVKDIDFANSGLYVMEAKGGKSRRTLLPESLIPSLKQQIGFVERQLASDTYTGKAGVYLPKALVPKRPNAQYDLLSFCGRARSPYYSGIIGHQSIETT